MIIRILGSESLGVRGLSCVIELKEKKIFIDPGIALGYLRHGLLPHPFQISVGIGIRNRIINELYDTTDIIFSHFDGDHCPLYNPNPYQMRLESVKSALSKCRIWAKSAEHCPPNQMIRREKIAETAAKGIHNAEGLKQGPMEFSLPVFHGAEDKKSNTVMMSRIEEDGLVFVHASDIQLLDEKAVDIIINWRPDIVLASGPPLYLLDSPKFDTLREHAWNNALRLSKNTDTLILDHHLLRSMEGKEWLEKLRAQSKGRVMCAADFMEQEPLFLEAWRNDLYEWLPVTEGWHDLYAQGIENAGKFQTKGWKLLAEKERIIPCKWYQICPIKRFTDEKKLNPYWVENYCLVGNRKCVRYQMEEKGEFHCDNMLPNGQIKKDLK